MIKNNKNVNKISIDAIVQRHKIKTFKNQYNVGKWVTYNNNIELGTIGGWLLESKRGIEDAYKLITKHKLTVYIHRELGSAVLGWNIRFEYYCGQLWKNKKMVEDFKLKSF